jgi:hypothetical protein
MAMIVGVMAVGSTAIGHTAEAGQVSPADVTVTILVSGPDAGDVLDGLTVELWPDRVDVPVLCSDQPETFPGASSLYVFTSLTCVDVDAGTYSIGLDGVPAGFTASASCTSSVPVEVEPNEVIADTESFEVLDVKLFPANCIVTVIQPVVLVDKIVDGGPASTDDFTIEVYSTGGGLVATGTDPSPDGCTAQPEFTSVADPVADACAVIAIPAGEYQLGEVALPGYAPTNVGCGSYFGDREAFPNGVGEFAVGDDTLGALPPIVICEITNSYFEGSVTVTKQVINDNGGTATADDFTAEVYLDGGALVASGACEPDGTCIDTDLAIGDHRIGENGPSGYVATVACTVTGGSVPEVGTVPPSTIVFDEAIAGESAGFTLEPNASVACVITNDDIAPTTGVLPPTGANRQPMVIALALLALGGSLVVARRRTA